MPLPRLWLLTSVIALVTTFPLAPDHHTRHCASRRTANKALSTVPVENKSKILGVIMSVHSASASGSPDTISAADVYPAQFRPSTPPAISTGLPPRKRQRLAKASANPDTIPRSVMRLLDIEADEDGIEEDEEEEDEGGDFIDDEPNHEMSAFPFVKLEEATVEDPEVLRRIAARFEDAARQEHEERELRNIGVEESHDGDTVLSALVAPSLHGFIIPCYWELRLVDFMKTLDGIGMVGTQGPSSCLVFYETVLDEEQAKGTNSRRVASAAQAWLTAHCVWFRGPHEIPPMECLALLGLRGQNNHDLALTDTRYNCFARFKSRIHGGIYENDLVFIDSARSAQIFVVPRVHVGPGPHADGQRPPPPSPPQCRGAEAPSWGGDIGVLERRQSVFVGRADFLLRFADWRFLSAEDWEYSLERVHPTDAELELFWASKCREISAAFTGTTSAVQEGDRVVVLDPIRGTSDDGEIAAFFERHEGDQRLRMAVVVLPHQEGKSARLDSTTGRLAVKKIGGIEVNGDACAIHVSELRLHVLSPRRVISVGDRVVVVGGSAYRGQSGRITTFSTASTISFDSPDLGEVEVALRHVRLDFRLGDMCDVTRMNARVDSQTGVMRLSVESPEFNTTKMTTEEAPVIRLQTYDVVFVHFEGNDLLQSIERRREADKEVEHARHEWERDAMNTGRFLTGIFVRIVGKHPKKGQFGVIVDYHRTKPAPEGRDRIRRIAEWGDLRRNVCIHVMVEHSRVADEVRLDNVVERFSGLPVLMAVLLKGYRKLMVFERQSRPPTPPAIEKSAIEKSDLTAAEIVSRLVSKSAPVDIGETDGCWLAHPQMLWKRIDAQVCDAETLLKLRNTPNVGNRVGVKVMKMADAVGYLRPFGFAITKDKAYAAVQEFLAPGRDARVPIVALRPLRRTPVNGERGDMCCISARKCRVIVIGPDVKGSEGRIGQYAETIPPHSLSSSGGVVIRVRFVWEKTKDGVDFQSQAEYDLQCLCSALNRDTPSQPPVPPTDFNKKCT
ncbi:hypothetical protein C8R45DRAFT_948216 [Mycena sanguinolenta]|nr:hypothetical protein C8R45DRAFT_948216 [Mycena sanguinolenta]